MSEIDNIFASYLEELSEVFASVMEWWERQESRANENAAVAKRLRACWPVGPVSHPRIVAVYRKYYLLISASNTKTLDDEERREAAPRITEEWWGRDDAEDEVVETFSPDQVLIDQLEQTHPTLHKHMMKFIFIPIALDEGGNPS